ncbi:hypothetical protein JTE90_025138 [Oedothorax gibbosus]|uniref:BHLH domain-containing protein n=1 Tax=Oedothorax gibbosus TaxID=931172 RepID=A0AAV6UHD2_9ARAC|nr:hypothetical protein JTE90_025138 [Oedothorax gibbosus]
MGRNKKINILPHHVKERLRHQNLQRLLDTVAKSVPSIPMKKETKAKKLRRIVLYMKFLLKKKWQLCTSPKQVQGDLPSILHIAKNAEVQREKKSDDAPKMYSEKKSKSGQPQIVFLRKSSSVSSPNRLPSTITSENERSTQTCNSDPQKSIEVSFTNRQGREVFQLRNPSFDCCTPFDKKYLQYDIQPPYELDKNPPTLEHYYSNACNKPRQANISQRYFKSTKNSRSEAASCPNTSDDGLYPNRKEYIISENGSDDSFRNTQSYYKPLKKNRSEATYCPNTSNDGLYPNQKEYIISENGSDDSFRNTQSYFKPAKKNRSEATYCPNSSDDVSQKEYPEYIFNENDAFSYQYSRQSNGPTATESRSRESRISDSLIYPYLESDHQLNTSGIESIESQRDKMSDETLNLPPLITVNPSTILYPNMYFGNATFVGTASKDVACVQDPENYNLEFFSSGESAAMASSGEWFSSDETQKMSQGSDNIALAAADIVESYDVNRSCDIYRDSTGTVRNVEQFEDIKKDFHPKSYLQRMSEESGNNALIEDIVEGYDGDRSCDIYKDSTDVEQFESIVQNRFYRESQLQNVLQKCDKYTQEARCDIYKDSTETAYDVEQFDHAQKSFYTESHLQNVLQMTDNLTNAQKSFYTESHLQNVLQKCDKNTQEASCDIYKDSTETAYDVEQFDHAQKSFYTESHLQNVLQMTNNLTNAQKSFYRESHLQNVLQKCDKNTQEASCDIYKDSTETAYEVEQFDHAQKSFYTESHLQNMLQMTDNLTNAQKSFYRESHLQNVLQKCDKNTQEASCDIYKDSTETAYDVEQFDHAQKSFYTESHLQNMLQMTDNLINAQKSFYAESHLQNVLQKYDGRNDPETSEANDKFYCDFYKDTLGKVYNAQQFENFNQFSVPKSFYTKYCLQNMLQKTCSNDSQDIQETGDTNSCDIYKDSTKTTMEHYENFNNLTSPMGFYANCDASTINTEFPANYNSYNNITNVIYPGLSQNNRINSQRNRQDFQQFYQDRNEVNTRDKSKEQNSPIPRSSSNANDSSFISPEYNVSHKEYNNVEIIAEREENFFLRGQDCSLKNSQNDMLYENSGIRMSSDEYNSSQNSNGNLISCDSNVNGSVLISPRKNLSQEEFNNLEITGKNEENYYRSSQDCLLNISQELYENSRISNSKHNSPQNSHESNENLISYNSNINDSIMISPVKNGVSLGEYSNVDIKVENEENYSISSQECLLNDSQELYENSGLRISNDGCNSPHKSNGNLISCNSNINDSIMISPVKNVASQQEYNNNVDIKVENEENYFISSPDCLLNDSPEFYENSGLRISNGGCNAPQSIQESNENLISYNSNINDSIMISPVLNGVSREEFNNVDIKVENEENYFMSNQDYDSQEMYENSGLRVSNSVCNSPQISQENSRLNSSNAGFYSPVKKEEFGSSSFNIGNEKNEESYDLSGFGGETHMRNLDVLFKDYFDVQDD